MFIGQEVFRMIVEMAYEMEFCDKVTEEIKNCKMLLPEFIDSTNDNRNKSTRLRKLYTDNYTKPNPVRYSLPWKRFEREYYHKLDHGYERYRNTRGQVRERGIMVITTVVKANTLSGVRELNYRTTMTYSSDEEFETAKQELKRYYGNGIGYYFWGWTLDRKPKYLK